MGVLLTPQYWLDVAERSLKTAAQTAAALLTAFVTSGARIEQVDWVMVLSISALATVFSVLTSIGSAAVGDHNSASLVK